MDLTEIEGLADLLNAETEIQRKQALRQAEVLIAKSFPMPSTVAHLTKTKCGFFGREVLKIFTNGGEIA